MIVYDPRGQTWDNWCALMAELFAAQQLGTVPEAHWQDWANGMQGVGYFVNSGIPDARGFTSWQDWAQRIVGILDIQDIT